MNKLTSILLSLTILAGAASVFAAEEDVMLINNAEENVELISEETEAQVPSLDSEKMMASGIVKAVSDTQIELEDLVLNISDYTYIGDYNFNPIEEVKVGDEIVALISTAQTRSLPPQSYAFYVLVKTEEAQTAPIYTTVGAVEDGFIKSQDGNYEITYETAEVSMFKVRSIIQAKDLTEGSEIVFYSDIMTMSIPALANASKILVLSVEGSEEASYLQQNGILLGTDKGLELTKNVTRAEAVTFLSRINSDEDKEVLGATTEKFNDVAEDHWAFDTIHWAKGAGIIDGTGEGKFSPNNNVTGRQFVKMLLSMNGVEDVTIENAFDKGLEAEIITDNVLAKVDNDVNLTRNDVSILLYNAITK